jgi:hypothetical protein
LEKIVSRKKKVVFEDVPRPNDGWTYTTELQIHGRNVSPGTELKIEGERGRFRFIKHVITELGVEWIDVWGGPKGAENIRSFRPDRVKRVHYKNQTVGNLAAEHKQKMKDKKAEAQSESSNEK